MNLTEILEFNFLNIGGYNLNLLHLLTATLILIGARLLVWMLTHSLLRKMFIQKHVMDVGRKYAIEQFLKYFIYTFAALFILQALGVQLSVLWAGSAALLVGIGLGLQQTFNDVVSGLILLFEGSVEVGDVVLVDGIVGSVTTIGLRTSRVETRDDYSIIIPNSKLVVDNVVNWSHNDNPTRFHVNVGIAYASDVQMITKLLLKAASEHKDILNQPQPKVQFLDFGNSSLDFKLHFFSHEYLKVDFIKSELRFRIIELFRENNVEIPFPQRDLWIRNQVNLVPENGSLPQ